jgi:hypothetical protein
LGFSIGALGVATIRDSITMISPFTLVRFFNRRIGCCHNKRIAMIGPFTLVGLYNSHGSLIL